MSKQRIAIIMGSKSDQEVADKATAVLDGFDVSYEVHVISAHRNPNKIRSYIRGAEEAGVSAIIAIAGLAAHLPGVIASMTVLPVIGVPVDTGPLRGQDALYAIVQMPPGIPVATVGIGNSRNAALLAVQMCSLADGKLRDELRTYREGFGDDPS